MGGKGPLTPHARSQRSLGLPCNPSGRPDHNSTRIPDRRTTVM